MSTVEIERKFRFDKFPDIEPAYVSMVTQNYLCMNPQVRIRKKETNGIISYYLAVKGPDKLKRVEVETKITEEQYDAINSLIEFTPITKETRVYVLDNGLVIECNHVDKGLSTEIMYADVEFSSVAEAKAFVPPDWLGEDITDDDSIKNNFKSRFSKE